MPIEEFLALAVVALGILVNLGMLWSFVRQG